MHWIQWNKSVRDPGAVIPVTVSVDDEGLIVLHGQNLSLRCWNHDPESVVAAVRRSGESALWKPRWKVLEVPRGGSSCLFYLGSPETRTPCKFSTD